MKDAIPRLPGEWHIEYQYSIGEMAAEFFAALREGRILGSECPSCHRVAVPPKAFCEYCFCPSREIIEVGASGTVEAVTIVTAGFKGAPPVPYCVAYVKLDGATSSIANYVRNVPLADGAELPAAIRVGAPVEVAFTEEPQGRITDFWFEPKAASEHE